MFRLQTFGGLWLEQDQQRVAGTSPRRLGLLAAVVAAGSRGLSRDRLLLLLWPDATESKARHALAQILYSIRRELGDELIRSDTAELLIDPQQLSSDFTDFTDAMARGDVDQAAALYTGPFLDGFYIPGADEFERWAETERTRLRELGIQALEAAARQAGEAGRPEAAANHWRRLTVLAPLNSRIAVGYMTSLADTGDVAGAIQYGRSHEISRRQELGAQPDAGVAALLSKLTAGHWPSRATAGASATASPVSADVPAGFTTPVEPLPVATVLKPKWRRPVLFTTVGLVLALGAWSVIPGLTRKPFPVGSSVVMADPVDLTGDPSLGRALASAASVGLQQSQRVSLLSRGRISAALKRMGRTGDSVLTDSLAAEVAARENARAVFSLTIAKVSESYLLTGRLLAPGDGRDIAVHRATAKKADDVVSALDEIVRKIQADAGDDRSFRDSLPFLPQVTSQSLEALKLFAEGGEAWRKARYDRARQLFEAAVARDSTFAMAHMALGSYAYFVNDREVGDRHYAAAKRYRDRLTLREQLALDSRLAAAAGNRMEEARITQTLADRFPGRDTWYDYGTSLMRASRCQDAIPALRKALTFDSTASNAYINLATCYKVLGENRLSLDNYARAEHFDSTALLSNFINHEWGAVFVRLKRYSEADAAFRRMLARPDPNDQARGHRSLAYLDMLQGKYKSAIDHLTQAVALSRERGAGLTLVRNEALLADAYQMRGLPALANRELDAAMQVARESTIEPGFLALLGRQLVRAGRLPEARSVLDRLEKSMKPENQTDRSARGLLTAEIALAQHKTVEAQEAIRNDIDQTLARWRNALTTRILEARGVLDSALTVAAAFSESEGFGIESQSDWVLAPLDVARISEALADSATARAALQTFLDRWKDADSDLAVVKAARARLARLQRAAPR